jgi:hypothetical protein
MDRKQGRVDEDIQTNNETINKKITYTLHMGKSMEK